MSGIRRARDPRGGYSAWVGSDRVNLHFSALVPRRTEPLASPAEDSISQGAKGRGRPEGSVPSAGHDGGVGDFHHGGFHFGLHLQRCVFPQRQQQRRPRRCWAPRRGCWGLQPRSQADACGQAGITCGSPSGLARLTDDPGGSRRQRTPAARGSFAPEMGPLARCLPPPGRPGTAVSPLAELSRPATDSVRSRLVETERLPLPESQASRLARGVWGREGAERPGVSLGAQTPSRARWSDRLLWAATRETVAVTIRTC